MFVAVLFSSCSALDMSPEDYNGSGNFWNSEAQVSGYINGMHSQLRGNYYKLYNLGEIRGGTLRYGSSTVGTSLDWDAVKSQDIDESKPGISNWYSFYSPIMQVNHFIQRVTEECGFLSDSSRSYYLGQAYGLRAFYYFMLYKTYGGVPLVTTVELLNGQVTADKFYQARATATETMALIKEDINKSESYFGNSTNLDRTSWSRYATLMLKAEIYMWAAKVDLPDSKYTATGSADLQTAKVALQTVISATGQFELLSDYSKVFTTKANKEVIFALHFDYNEEIQSYAGQFYSAEDLFKGVVYDRSGKLIDTDVLDLRGKGGPLRYEYKESLWRSYDEKDLRRDATFFDFYKQTMGCLMLKCKGSIDVNGNRVFDSDYIVYRYSDALLMMAECENGLGNSCASYINQVRQRAYGDNYNSSVAYTDGTYAENELAILKERDKEFPYEGKRWFDVVRMRDANHKSLAFSAVANYADTYGDAPTSLIKSGFEYTILWPVDVANLTNNPLLKQTPGYTTAYSDR